MRSHGRDRAAARRVRAALEHYARIGEGDAVELDARAAAELVRVWVEEVDHGATAEPLEAEPAKS